MTIRDKIANAVSLGFMHHDNTFEIADAVLALPEIANLQAKLAEVEAERDEWKGVYHQADRHHMEAERCTKTAEAKLAEVEAELAEMTHDRNIVLNTSGETFIRAVAAEAAIPRAYQLGLEAAASKGYTICAETRHVTLGDRVSKAIRAMQPPADLVEQCKKEVK